MAPATLSSPEDFSRYDLKKLHELATKLPPGSPILASVEQAIRLKTGRSLPAKGDD
jgi:hypothetical protein